MLGFVITGTGRSGTGYCAAVLRAVGVDCGHERIFRPGNGSVGCMSALRTEGDASWLAVEYLPALKHEGVTIIHVVRNPLDVVSSLVGMRFFSDAAHGPYRECAQRILVGLGLATSGHDKWDAIEWWWRVTSHVCDYAKPTRLEHLDLPNLCDPIGKVLRHEDYRAAAKVPRNMNHRTRAELTYEDLRAANPGGYARLAEIATDIGYEVPA